MEEIKSSENKKVKNATRVLYDNINFRSLFEKDCYVLLKQAGFNFEYETKRIVLLSGFYPPDFIKIYDLYKPRLKKRVFGINKSKILDITYTPDFYLQKNDVEIYIEAKGNPNDAYPIKKKMFLNYLRMQAEITGKTFMFFEPHSKKQMKDTIKIINDL